MLYCDNSSNKNMEQTVSMVQRRKKSETADVYHRLHSFIDSIESKIVNRIQMVKDVYLQDYQQQVKQMTSELAKMRTQLDEELLRQRANQRMFFLEEERDFFRAQVTKLNQELTASHKKNAHLKEQITQAKADAEDYKNVVIELQKKVVRAQKETVEMRNLTMAQSTTLPKATKHQDLSTMPTRTPLHQVSPPTFRRPAASITLRRSESLNPREVDKEVCRRDQIVDDCIKQVKKRIFYRTVGGQSTGGMLRDESKAITIENFKKTDKDALLKEMLTNSELLEQFGDFVANRKTPNPLSDPHKRTFSDKIFKIKLLGVGKK